MIFYAGDENFSLVPTQKLLLVCFSWREFELHRQINFSQGGQGRDNPIKVGLASHFALLVNQVTCLTDL